MRAAVITAAFLLGFTMGGAAVEAAQPDPAAGAADWLFGGGLVYTVDPARPHAEAVAVRGDTIVYVGDRAGAEAWKGKDTREVDLAGRMLLPGFVDAHDHLSCLGATKLGVNVRGLKGKEAILERVRSWVVQQPKDAVLRGHGWSMESFGDVSPRREWLDAVTGDRPMYVLSFDMHDLWFNTAAMRLAGVTATAIFRSESWARCGPAPCGTIRARSPPCSAHGISDCGRTTCRSASASSGATGCCSAAARSRSRPTATIRSRTAA